VLSGILAAIALALATIGLYGVVAYTVAQRTREIGIRIALGAARSDVIAMVQRQSLALVIAGLTIGLGGAAATSRYLQSLLFGLSPLDGTTFASVAIAFAAVTMLASYVPARRATMVDPAIALRSE
jgi:ABC-type antimicrobial peptide transport system permease subunit